MLEAANRPIEEVVRFLARWGVEAEYLVPTATGLQKSIMDAHGALRHYFRAVGLHDYGLQGQGPDSKVVLRAWMLDAYERTPTRVSLYRPKTKSGDPRIWFSGLTRQAMPGDLLVVLAHDGELFVANASRAGILESAMDPQSPLGSLLTEIAARREGPAVELLERLREIGSRGFVRSLRAGPTGVGMTLETLLGIQANSSRQPDYKGIELKASRTRKTGRVLGNRITLFSKVPDWNVSAITSAVELLERHGYDRGGRRQLYCTLSPTPNTQGLFLRTDPDALHASHGVVDRPVDVVQWAMNALQVALAEKHHETFWVKATVRHGSQGEEFHYKEVLHTRAPLVSNLRTLLDLGHVEVDFLLHLLARAPGQAPRARDHGYLFKIAPRNLDMLFPPNIRYALA